MLMFVIIVGIIGVIAAFFTYIESERYKDRNTFSSVFCNHKEN